MSAEPFASDHEWHERHELAIRLRRKQDVALAFNAMANGVLDKVAKGGDRHNVAFYLSIRPEHWKLACDMGNAVVAQVLDKSLSEVTNTPVTPLEPTSNNMLLLTMRHFSLTGGLALDEYAATYDDSTGTLSYWVIPQYLA
ncbi:MAG TPA: hypothetical protein VLI54_03170 [Bacillota bacterium]|nr:hypothetical protein [Bacillota bacterium]